MFRTNCETLKSLNMVNILIHLASILLCITVSGTLGMPHLINLSVRPIRTDCSLPEVGSKPFFYGTNNLACMYLTAIGLHRKKRSLQLPVHNFVHSFIYYDGWFAEFGTKDTTLRRQSPKNAHCGPKIILPPAGFTKLPFECLQKCASKYHLVFGNYHLLKNNCHFFSNRMMELLCHEVTCPEWCL